MLRILLVVITLSGCVAQQPLEQFVIEQEPMIERESVYLATTPFFPQQQYQCGPAALATLLNDSGVSVQSTELVSKVYIPERKGSLQVEMFAASRQYQRIPYQIDPTLEAMLDELYSERPVLVMQNLGFESKPFWHYAVVVGFVFESNEIILRSGTDFDKRMDVEKFLQTWQRAENWAFVLLDLDVLPENPDFNRYFQSVVSMEQVLNAEQMIQLYEQTNQNFPEQTMVAFGLADAYGRSGRLPDAAIEYKRILAADPEHVAATNNLALTLQELSCATEALKMAQRAVSLSQNSGQFISESQDTLQTIMSEQQGKESSGKCQIEFQITGVDSNE